MPFIHIKSLPMHDEHEIPHILTAVSRDFAVQTGVGLEHVTATWEYFKPGHYCTAGVAAPHSQPRNMHPVIVDLLSPDFNTDEMIQKMLETIADSLSSHTGIRRENIFVHHRQARSGMVYDGGKVVRW